MNFNRLYSSLGLRTPEGLDNMRVIVQDVINDRKRYERLLEARGDEAQQCLDALQVLAESPSVNFKLRSLILRMMLHLSKRSGLCPNCLNIKNVKRIGDWPIGGGGFGDVWKGKIDDHVVCLKVVKVYAMSDVQKLLKEYMGEAIVWQSLHHPNLLPFMGMYYLDKAREQLCLVSPWMDRGNLVRYLKDTPREAVDHQALAYDVASGLAHLHSMKIVHGDLKGVNVLMTPDERACIADFGLSRVADTHSLRLSATTTGQARGTTRWLAPELLRPDPPSSASMKSDMYAYACVCYEIFTSGNTPFYQLAEAAVIVAVLLDKRHPSRPGGVGELADGMWKIMVACWNHEPQDRPASEDVCSRVGELNSRKTGHQVQSYPAQEWDARPLAQVRRNVKYPPVDANAIVQFLSLPSPSHSPTSDRRKGSSDVAPDMPPPAAALRHHRPQSNGNIPLVRTLVHVPESSAGSIWRRMTQRGDIPSDEVHRHLGEPSETIFPYVPPYVLAADAPYVPSASPKVGPGAPHPEQSGNDQSSQFDVPQSAPLLHSDPTVMTPQTATLSREPHSDTDELRRSGEDSEFLGFDDEGDGEEESPEDSAELSILEPEFVDPVSASMNPSDLLVSHSHAVQLAESNDPFRALPLLSSDLPHTRISVSHSFVRPNDQGQEILSLVVHVDPGNRKEGWKVEKNYSHVLDLDQRVRNKVAKGVRKKIATLPGGKLWKDHAPAKVDQRKAVLENYFQSLINLPVKSNDEVVAFFTTGILREITQPVMQAGHKEGFLTKRGKNLSGWKTRYFVLQGPILEYFVSRGVTHLGSINVTGAQIGRRQRNATSSTTDDEKEYRHAFLIVEAKKGPGGNHPRHVLCAESDEERDSWVEILVRYFSGSYSEEPVYRSSTGLHPSYNRYVGRTTGPLSYSLAVQRNAISQQIRDGDDED
ncbi:Rho GTPase activating protein [Marasmius sp. AFHP31]|nr:Rho GTPase activating protein [Marasmius sp. AFHP31]